MSECAGDRALVGGAAESRVKYPGLKSNPQHDLARKQNARLAEGDDRLKTDIAGTRRFLENTLSLSRRELGGSKVGSIIPAYDLSSVPKDP